MNTSNLSDIIHFLKHVYRFNVSELPADRTRSGEPGFTATRDMGTVTLVYDGGLTLNNEPVKVPRSATEFSNFDIDSTDDVRWLQDNIDMICRKISEQFLSSAAGADDSAGT